MKYLILLIFLIIPTLLISQINIKGKVADRSQPIVWANVALTNLNGDIVTGAITDDNGVFVLKTEPGTYKLIISFIGYTTYKKDITLKNSLDLNTIILNADNTLDEIIITHQKKLIEQIDSDKKETKSSSQKESLNNFIEHLFAQQPSEKILIPIKNGYVIENLSRSQSEIYAPEYHYCTILFPYEY